MDTPAATKTVSLHDPDAVWLVEAGEVDLFAVTAWPDGEVTTTGRWRHLQRIGAGEALWGMVPATQPAAGPTTAQSVGAAAGGSGAPVVPPPADRPPTVSLFFQPLPRAQVRRVTRSELLTEAGASCADTAGAPAAANAAAGAKVADLLERWLVKLRDAVHVETLPSHWSLLVGAAADYGAAACLIPDGFAWVAHHSGGSAWCGRTELAIDEATGLVALPPRAWLETTADSRLVVTSTQLLLARGQAAAALDATHRLLLQAFAADLGRATATEQRRLDTRLAHDQMLMEDALQRLAASIRHGAAGTGGAGVGVGLGAKDPLFQACRLVCEALGIEITVPTAMQEGRSLQDPIQEIAFASRIQVRPVRLRGNWWRKDNGPLLTFIDRDDQLYPVALLPLTPGTYEVVEPDTGQRRRVTAAMAKEFHPQAFMFYPSLPARIVTGLDLLRLGFRSIWWRDLLLVMTMGLAAGGLGTLVPLVTGDLFDRIIPQADASQIWPLAFLLVAAAFGVLLFEFTRSIAMQRMEGRLEMTMQAAVWDRVINLPANFFRRFSAGDLTLRAMGIDSIRQAVSGMAVTTILSSVYAVFNYGLLFYYDRGLALMATLILLLALAVTVMLGYLQVRHQRALTELQGRISGLVLQLINGINKFRMAGAEERAFHLWAEQFAHQRQVTVKAQTTQNILTVFHAVLPVATNLVLFTAFLNAGSTLSTGRFLAFLTAFSMVNTALMALSSTLLGLLNIIPYYERSKPILEALPEIEPDSEDPGPLTGEIELSHVWFRYAEDGPWVVQDTSMHVRPGTFVAIVGPSGHGKSTLLRLLLGFEKPASGAIYYNGKDFSTLDRRAVRRQIGVVLQSGVVTQGDIFTFITGAANVSMDDAWAAARMAGLAADIEQMPMGMHTMVPEGGGTLSGGQRQRLLIARALVRKPRILLFDEATSALDNQTQAAVMESLAQLQATRIVIAHRLSTIMQADRILVFNQGSVAESGTYAELIDQNGLFAQLARRQLA